MQLDLVKEKKCQSEGVVGCLRRRLINGQVALCVNVCVSVSLCVCYQMKSVQWLQKVGCLKKRAVNWWSFTSTILLCLSAPFLWNTGTLGGGERGEGSGGVADVGEASANGERDGEGETGVDMMPGGYGGKKGEKEGEGENA
ncbi:hypothetical protein KUCAC02_013511 [Chaenocephalus aceratus]|uniref:Uncharacterized protein n=1 Tax=Chaenocephalus aceratus TaxID=36190 RepID=A0ACB9WBV9_CHAAC|nr:hypothetical protein KUCAC02_013511 [Chaenocephalus aceratus]